MTKLKAQAETPPERVHQLVSASNLMYWEALWDAAKQTNDLIVLRRHGSPIDIISERGTKWTKITTISEKRLLMEMAKQGWDWAGSDDESDDEFSRPVSDDDDMDISIVKMARQLRDLSRKARIRYKYPEVHYILTRIKPGNKDIDLILDRIRATGAKVTTADQLSQAPSIESAVNNMAIDEFKYFTPVLNVDCTLLLAIVSDISHGQVKEEPWFNRNVRTQIKIEEKERLMERVLWPAMGDHELVCSKLAAQRMREIVDTIGTPTEKARTRLIMGDDASLSGESLLQELQKYSSHSIPSAWKLPIKTMDDLPPVQSSQALGARVMSHLTDVNLSVFTHGWRSGYTTITSNRVAVKTIEKAVEDYRTSDTDAGPDVWICATARSLVAKEKDRRDGNSLKHDSGLA